MATIEPYQTSSGATPYAVRYRKPDSKQTWKRGFTRKRDAQGSPQRWSVQDARRVRRASTGQGHGRRTGAQLADPQTASHPTIALAGAGICVARPRTTTLGERAGSRRGPAGR